MGTRAHDDGGESHSAATKRPRGSDRGDLELARFFAISLDLLCIASLEGHFLRVNPEFMRVLGYSEHELLERPFLDFVHPDDVEATLTEMRSLSDDTETWHFENRYRCADDSWVWLSWNARPVVEEGLIYASAKNVSHLKLVEAQLAARNQELMRADRMRSEFLANMSHELRTPLNAIIGFSDLLGDELPGPLNETQREYVTQVHDSGQHLLQLINEILDLSKVEAGVLQLAREIIDGPTLLHRCVSVLRDAAMARRLTVRVDVNPRFGAIDVDPVRMRQIVYNLVSNAIKFTDEGSRVDVRGWHDDQGALCVSVHDEGPGIPQADQARMFEPFVQLDGSMSRRHEGAGLGLALVHRLCELHGGTVTCDSVPGKGTTFNVCIPQDPVAIASEGISP